MKTRYLYLLGIILGVIDLATVNLSFLIAFKMSSPPGAESLWSGMYYNCLIISNILWFLASVLSGMYGDKLIQGVEFIYRATFRSFILHFALFVFYIVFSKEIGISRYFLVLFYSFMAFGFLLSRFGGVFMEMFLKRHFKIRKPVAVLGMNKTGLRLAAFFEKNKSTFSFEGFLDGEEGLYVDEKGKILPSASEQLREAAQSGVNEVYVSLTPDRMAEVGYLAQEAEKQCVRLKLVPDFTGSLVTPFRLSYMDEFPVISLRKEPLEDIQNRFKKRVFDILFSSLVILFILSWLYPVIAIIIKLQSPGPVLFKQLRSGRNNQPFLCYKFRSMKLNKESDTKLVTKDDDRVTPFGSFLRKTSLDELPQFFNVLKGNMSVVGPRPHPLLFTKQYSEIINKFMVRHFLKSGITGWAQVNGYRGEMTPELVQKRVEHDIWYLENWSVMLDVKIIFMTIINMIRGEENAY